jgi:hypothetical protein
MAQYVMNDNMMKISNHFFEKNKTLNINDESIENIIINGNNIKLPKPSSKIDEDGLELKFFEDGGSPNMYDITKIIMNLQSKIISLEKKYNKLEKTLKGVLLE